MKSKVIILQVDNRPTYNILLSTQQVNKHMCDHFADYDVKYMFQNLNDISDAKLINKQPGDRRGWNTKYKKMFAVQDMLQSNEFSFMIFLDSDAWVQNPNHVNQLLNRLEGQQTKIGAFSRDPYIESNTHINSGSFILKCNEASINMYDQIIFNYKTKPKSPNKHKNHIKFHDQYFVSEYVEQNKSQFDIFEPDVLNTPTGQVLRHYWFNKRDDKDFNRQTTQLMKTSDFDNTKYNFDARLDDK